MSDGWGPVTPNSWVDANNGIYPSDPSITPPSEVVIGGLGQTARRLLPRKPNPDVYGGELNFSMAVDPAGQNHLTIKLWGSDTSSGIWFVLNVDGKELGLRHGGDSAAPDMLFGNKQIVSFAPNRWVYRTVALPLHLTRGEASVALKIRSMGWISDYDAGPFFGAYNKLMNSPSLGLYRIYTHLGSKLDISGEAQGSGFAPSSPRAVENETTVINNIKNAVNSQLANYLGAAPASLSPTQIAWMAKCYDAKENLGEFWISYGGTHTAATLVSKVIAAIDYHVGRQANDGNYFNSFGNSSWGGGFGPLGEAIRLLWPQINSGATMSTTVAYGGSYGSITRTSAWSRSLRTSVDFGRYNRRSGLYANQDISGVENTYNANRGLLLVDPANAIQEVEALRYLKEACGLLPWAGNDQNGGGTIPVKGTFPYGNTYYSVTSDGTTKDGGAFVGSDYGEMGATIARWGMVSGDSALLNRGLQMLRARAVFRFPSFDSSGYRVMQGANPIGVRNRTLPGHDGYLDRGDGAPDIAALGTTVIGADLTGYFQNGINDGQQLRMMSGSKDPYLVRNWTIAKAIPATNVSVPMSPGAPDFAWVDEENMVVAAKSGENRIFANLHWAAPNHVNGWAKIFHLPATSAPEYAEVQLNDVRFRPTGTFTTLGRRVESSSRQPFDDPESAYNRYVAPKAWRSDLTSIPANNVDDGKGTGYTLRYGHWLIGINPHHADSYEVLLPSNFSSFLPIKDLVSGAMTTTSTVTLAPKASAVFYLPDVVDPAPRPSRPLLLTAKSTATTIVLDWDDASGATTYNVKRSTTTGSGFITIGATSSSSYVDSTAVAATTYYYVISAVSDGGEGGNSPQASAVLKSSGLLNRASGGAATASLSHASFPPANAFDGSAGTKWNSSSTGVTAWLQYDFGVNITWAVTHYEVTSADTINRDPRDWVFQGSNDGTTWSTLDTRSGENFSARGQTRQFSITNNTGYRFYRLHVSAASGGLGFEVQLSELALFASSPGSVPLPPAPASLSATSGNQQVFLNWPAVAGVGSYVVKRSSSVSGAFVPIGTTESHHFLDSSAPASGVYHYVVASINPGGEGDPSPSASASFGPIMPLAPTQPSASNGPGAGNVTLTWDASPGVPVYQVKRSNVTGGPYSTIASGISDLCFVDSGRPNGVTCYYVISAMIGGAESPDSTEVSITPQSFAWNGSSSNWSIASNWGGTVPGNGSLLIFGGSPSSTSTSNNLTGLNISGMIFNSGAASFNISGNSLTLSGNVVGNATNTQTIGLGLILSGNRTFDIQSGQINVSGPISDGAASYNVTKTGPGTLALTAANSFDGGLNISAGTLQIGTSTNSTASGSINSLGATGSTVNLGAATLRFQMGNASNNTLPQNFVFNAGATLATNDGKVTLGSSANTIAVNGATLLQAMWQNKWFVLGGIVTGSGEISIKNGGSTQHSAVAFTNGANTYNGTITVEDGNSSMASLAVGNDLALRFAEIQVLNTQAGRYGVWFDTAAPVLGSLSGVPGSSILLNTDGGLHGSGPSLANPPVNLSVGFNHLDSLYQGDLSGTGGLTKVGSGTFTLAGGNTYSGQTNVNSGTLVLASPLIGTGEVVLHNGGKLVSASPLGGTLVVNAGGIVSPGGDETGVLETNGMTLQQNGIIEMDLGAVGNSDEIALTGGNYTPPSSGQALLHLSAIAGFGPGVYPLVSGATGISESHFSIPVTAPTGYTYALSASNGTLLLTVTGPPAMPTGLLAYGADSTVSLVWDVASGADTYTIYRSTSPDSEFSSIGTSTVPSFTASSLINGTPYYFRVSATSSYGEGGLSHTATATPNPNLWSSTPTSLDWSVASNWGGSAPIDNARLSFGASTATNLNNDIEGITVGGFQFNSGASAYTLSGEPILLSSDIINQSTSTQTFEMQMTLLGNRSVHTNTGAIRINGNIDDGGSNYGFIKTGSGSFTLAGVNSFTGGLILNAGTLSLIGPSSAAASGWIQLNGGTLQLTSAVIQGTLNVPTGSTVAMVKNQGTSNTQIYGNLTGGGTINESGNANGLHWFGDNSRFAGTINSANSGGNSRWRFNSPESGSAAAVWNLNNTATDSYGFAFGSNSTISFGALSGTGYFRNNGNGSATMRIGDLGLSTTMSGTTMFGIGLLKVGTGTLTLSGANFHHSNPTTVSAGTLNLSSSGVINTSAVTVQNGATLSGTGSLGGIVTIESGGNLSPGNGGSGGMGNLTLNNTFIPRSGSHLHFEVGSTSDQITLGLNSGFTAPSGGSVNIHLAAASGFAAGTYTLINNLGSGVLNVSNFSIASLPADHAAILSLNGTSLEVTIRFAGASWTGSTSGAWNDASNWDGTLPLDGDKLSFSTSASTTLNNNLTNLLVRGMTFNSGASSFSISGNSIRLGGDIVNNSTSVQTINTSMVLTSNVTVHSNTGSIVLGGAISESGGSFSMNKTGIGNLTLSGVNTFTGGFATSTGDVYISGIGTGVAGAATSGAFGTGSVTLGGGRIIYNSGAVALYNNFTALEGTTTTFREAVAQPLDLFGAINGSGNIVLDATVNYNGIRLAGDNSGFTGTFTFNSTGSSARHKFNSANAGSAAAKWVLNGPTDSGSMNFGAGTIHFGELSGNASQIRNNQSGVATVSIGALNTDSTFSGVFSSVGTLALTKVGTGSLTLAGTNTYTGATTIQNGRLVFTGNKSGTGQVLIQNGGTLAGTATVAGAVTLDSGGAISPGHNGTGVLTLTGNTTFSAGGHLHYDLGNPAASDRLALTGTTFTGPNGGTVNLSITAASGFGAGSYPLITGANGISAEGFSIGSAPPGFTYQFSAASGTLSLIVIEAVIPPAPTGLAAIGGAQQIDLSWSAAAGASSYTVKRSISPGGPFAVIASGHTATSFTDVGLPDGVIRYYVVSGTSPAGEGPHSSEATASTLTTQQIWRQTYFGVTSATGNASDMADPDGDGLVNLLEYATASSPISPGGAPVVLAKSPDGLRMTVSFHRIADPDLLYRVEASDQTPMGPWTAVWSSQGISAGPVTITDSALISNETRRFLRVVVSR